jgi:hypothetical protein
MAGWYTREADRGRGGKCAVTKLKEHRKNKTSQTAPESLGKISKLKAKQIDERPSGAP